MEDEVKVSITEKIKMVAQEVVKAERESCPHKLAYENLEGRVDDMQSQITEGFDKIEKIMKEKDEKKDNKKWDITSDAIKTVIAVLILFIFKKFGIF